jgi:folate-binding protein YgfZ
MNAALRERLEAAGAVFGEVAGRVVPRHFGNGAAEYAAIRESAGLAQRGDVARFRLWGRDPVKMMQGLITNDLAGAPEGQGVYGAMLTPKGRMIADLRAFRRSVDGGTEVLLELAAEAAYGTREHLKKFVPPLFARWEDASDSTESLGLYGPTAEGIISGLFPEHVPSGREDAFADVRWNDTRVVIVRTYAIGLENGFDLIVPAESAAPLWDALLARGAARPVGHGVLDTLRIEAGRPRFGAELTEDTIPTEAYQETGQLERAISFTKGCYTGQEVIVRIAHRGHVNRHLRGLLLGDVPAPVAGTPLHHAESGKVIGSTASSAASPRLGQTIALGYVRREVEPGGEVRVGGPDGDAATVVRLPFAVVQ